MSGLVCGAAEHLAASALELLGRPMYSAAEGAAGIAALAVQVLCSLCWDGRPSSLESRFLTAVRSCRDPHWAEVQQLLDEEADELFCRQGLAGCDKVSFLEFQQLKPRLLEHAMELRDDMKAVFERFERRYRSETREQEVDLQEVKAVFHLVLQARTDVIASMLRGDFTLVWRRIGENNSSSGLVDVQALHQHARSYASRLPTSGIKFSDEDVAGIADRYSSAYGDLPLESVEFSALIQELYLELLLVAWMTSSAEAPAREDAAIAWLAGPSASVQAPACVERAAKRCVQRSGDPTKYAFHGASLAAAA